MSDVEIGSTGVNVELSFTLNMGNYQSFKVSIGIQDWQRETDKSVDDAIERVYSYLERKLVQKLEESKSEMERFSDYN